jgi:hypothetical protein
VHFVGRLATYKYYNMDQVVAQALTLYKKLTGKSENEKLYVKPAGVSELVKGKGSGNGKANGKMAAEDRPNGKALTGTAILANGSTTGNGSASNGSVTKINKNGKS